HGPGTGFHLPGSLSPALRPTGPHHRAVPISAVPNLAYPLSRPRASLEAAAGVDVGPAKALQCRCIKAAVDPDVARVQGEHEPAVGTVLLHLRHDQPLQVDPQVDGVGHIDAELADRALDRLLYRVDALLERFRHGALNDCMVYAVQLLDPHYFQAFQRGRSTPT